MALVWSRAHPAIDPAKPRHWLLRITSACASPTQRSYLALAASATCALAVKAYVREMRRPTDRRLALFTARASSARDWLLAAVRTTHRLQQTQYGQTACRNTCHMSLRYTTAECAASCAGLGTFLTLSFSIRRHSLRRVLRFVAPLATLTRIHRMPLVDQIGATRKHTVLKFGHGCS